MMPKRRWFKICCALFIAAAAFIACSSGTSPVKFYTLGAMDTPRSAPHPAAGQAPPTIGVGPVELPDYLNRPQIVTRTSPHRLDVAEFHRWAGSLQTDFARILAANLSALLKTDRVVLHPWSQRLDPHYRIALDIQRFDGMPGGMVSLDVTWQLAAGKSGLAPLMRKSHLTAPVAADDYEALVAAKSRVLADLSREIAAEIRKMQTQR